MKLFLVTRAVERVWEQMQNFVLGVVDFGLGSWKNTYPRAGAGHLLGNSAWPDLSRILARRRQYSGVTA